MSALKHIYNKNDIGLYRDDGLAVFRNTSGPQAEKIKKHFQSIFRKNNLSIIVKCNLKIVDYLDVTLNLSDGLYKPFHKPNSEINYIHMESIDPPSIMKQLPLSVESRSSKLSSDENLFIQASCISQEALKRVGYNHKLINKVIIIVINIIAITIIIIVIVMVIVIITITIIIIRISLIVMIIEVIIIKIIIQGQANSKRGT